MEKSYWVFVEGTPVVPTFGCLAYTNTSSQQQFITNKTKKSSVKDAHNAKISTDVLQ